METNNHSYDVIIIGAGLGGLTAGATLARNHRKVLVLEQHHVPGGCATVFKRDGVTYEVGLHEMDWGTPDTDMKTYVFRRIGLDGKLPLVKLPQAWSVKTESAFYTVPEGRHNMIKSLGECFPDEKRNLIRFVRSLKRSALIAGRLPGDLSFMQFLVFPINRLPRLLHGLWKREHTGQKMDKLLRSNRLKNILNANLPYYSDDTADLSWSYYACAQYNYLNSAVFIKGGSQVLSNALADIIQKNGGEVRTSCDAKQVLMENGQVCGVSYYDKRTQKNVCVHAPVIIANIDPANLFDGKMLPVALQEPGIDKLKPATSLYTVYITFKSAPSKQYALSYSNFIYTDKLLDMPPAKLYPYLKTQPTGERPFVFVDYSAIDSGLTAPDDPRSFGVLTGTSNLADWENLNEEEYKTAKELLAQRLFERLEEHYPGITNLIERYEVATPKTTRRFLRTRNGTAYGFRNTDYVLSGRAPVHSETVKGLYYAGAWTSPGGGFTGAIVSGYRTALEIITPTWKRMMRKTGQLLLFLAVVAALIYAVAAI